MRSIAKIMTTASQLWPLYLAVVIDLCSRRIVGWALADHLRSDLVVKAMKQAIASRRHTTGLIFHSDRGSTQDLHRQELHPAMRRPARDPPEHGTCGFVLR